MSEIENILEEIRFKAGIYRDQKRRNEAYNDENYNCYMILNYIEAKDKEIERLNNIIKELEKYLIEDNYKNEDVWCITTQEVLNKLQELKGEKG